MKKDNKVYLNDIVRAIDKIEKYTALLDHNSFHANNLIQDAVIRQLEIIGEASKRLSVDFLKQYEELAFKRASAMRNLLIHEYDFVEVDKVWLVIKDNLPEFKAQIIVVLEKLG